MSKKDKLTTVVNALVTRLEKAESFALEQAPDVCKEIIAEKTAILKFDILAQLALFVLLAAMSILSAKLLPEAKSNWNPDPNWVFCAIFGAVFFAPLISAYYDLKSAISLRAAPKLTILRELRNLVK